MFDCLNLSSPCRVSSVHPSPVEEVCDQTIQKWAWYMVVFEYDHGDY